MKKVKEKSWNPYISTVSGLVRGRGRRTWTLGTRFWSSSGGLIFGTYYCYLVLYSLLICLLWTIICQFFIKNIFLVQKFCTNVRKMLEAVLEELQFLPLLTIWWLHHSEKFNFFFHDFCSKTACIKFKQSNFLTIIQSIIP